MGASIRAEVARDLRALADLRLDGGDAVAILNTAADLLEECSCSALEDKVEAPRYLRRADGVTAECTLCGSIVVVHEIDGDWRSPAHDEWHAAAAVSVSGAISKTQAKEMLDYFVDAAVVRRNRVANRPLKSDTPIVINGDVYGWDDFKNKVDKAIAESRTT